MQLPPYLFLRDHFSAEYQFLVHRNSEEYNRLPTCDLRVVTSAGHALRSLAREKARVLSQHKELVKSTQDRTREKISAYIPSKILLHSTREFHLSPTITCRHASIKAGVAVAFSQGKRPEQQDNFVATRFSIKRGRNTLEFHLQGVFDGHSGKDGSIYVAFLLAETLKKQLMIFCPNEITFDGMDNALTHTCVNLHVQMLDKNLNCGTTANFSVIFRKHLWVVNSGDSMAILYTESGKTKQLSRDLKVRFPITHPGIKKRGGSIIRNRVDGGLNMARSIGDEGINPRPTITYLDLQTIEPGYIVHVTDGITDVTGNVGIIGEVLKKSRLENRSLDLCAATLVEFAFQAGSSDNMTVLIAKLPDYSQIDDRGKERAPDYLPLHEPIRSNADEIQVQRESEGGSANGSFALIRRESPAVLPLRGQSLILSDQDRPDLGVAYLGEKPFQETFCISIDPNTFASVLLHSVSDPIQVVVIQKVKAVIKQFYAAGASETELLNLIKKLAEITFSDGSAVYFYIEFLSNGVRKVGTAGFRVRTINHTKLNAEFHILLSPEVASIVSPKETERLLQRSLAKCSSFSVAAANLIKFAAKKGLTGPAYVSINSTANIGSSAVQKNHMGGSV